MQGSVPPAAVSPLQQVTPSGQDGGSQHLQHIADSAMLQPFSCQQQSPPAMQSAHLRMQQPQTSSSPDTAMHYAEQVGWLSNRSAELQAALDFQTQRASKLEAAQEAAAAQATQDESINGQIHAAASAARNSALQEADANWVSEVESLRMQLDEAHHELADAQERAAASDNRWEATDFMLTASSHSILELEPFALSAILFEWCHLRCSLIEHESF